MTELEFCRIFAANLDQAIMESGYTKSEIARMSGLDPSTITKYLTGRRTPSIIAVVNLANTLMCPLTDLIADFDYID